MNKRDCLSSHLTPVFGADIMYILECVDVLLDSLVLLSRTDTQIILAYGRNRQAESAFLEKAEILFYVSDIPGSDLDATYQCSDVRVLKLRKRNSKSVFVYACQVARETLNPITFGQS